MRCPCCAVIVFLVLVLWCDDWLVVWVNLAELHRPVQTGRLLTRKSILRKVTSQSLLVEHGGVTAEETPLGCFNYLSIIVFNRKADVENLKYLKISHLPLLLLPLLLPSSSPPSYLTSTVHVRIIPVCLALTTETVHIRVSKNFFMSCRETARPLLGENQPHH